MVAERDAAQRIGFIGLGHMGRLMVARLLAAGYALTVYDRAPERARPHADTGAAVAATPRQVAAQCDVVMASVTDDAAVQEVMLGADGVLAGVRMDSLVIDLSSVAPQTSRRVWAAARANGVAMIDAPVSGSTPQAEQGLLTIFVGGEQHSFERCQPILEVLGTTVWYMGPSGAGTMMKLVVNTLLGVEMQALAEAIALGQKAGLEKGRLLDVLEQTALIAPAHKAKFANARREEYPVTFALRLMHKDFGLIQQEATSLAVPMPATAAAQQACTAEQAKNTEEDYAAVIRLMEEWAGVTPRPV
jgi:3-hydroxyisobutyrate dehydrogenase